MEPAVDLGVVAPSRPDIVRLADFAASPPVAPPQIIEGNGGDDAADCLRYLMATKSRTIMQREVRPMAESQ